MIIIIWLGSLKTHFREIRWRYHEMSLTYILIYYFDFFSLFLHLHLSVSDLCILIIIYIYTLVVWFSSLNREKKMGIFLHSFREELLQPGWEIIIKLFCFHNQHRHKISNRLIGAWLVGWLRIIRRGFLTSHLFHHLLF